MKIKCILGFLVYSFLSIAMEEQPLSFLDSQEVQDVAEEVVHLQLVDNNERPLYTIQIPYSFAYRFSVIRNSLQFEEEEEGKISTVQLPVSAVTKEQLQVLQELAHENYRIKNLEQSLDILISRWFPDHIKKFADLLNISNYLGNDSVYKKCMTLLVTILQTLHGRKDWKDFLQVPFFIKGLDSQEGLKKELLEKGILNELIDRLDPKKKLFEEITSPFDIESLPEHQWLISLLKRRPASDYFAEIVTVPQRSDPRIIALPNSNKTDIHSLHYSSSKKLLYIFGKKGMRCFAESGKEMNAVISFVSYSPYKVFFSKNEQVVAAALSDRLLIYSLNSLQLIKQFDRAQVSSSPTVALSASGMYVAFVNKEYLLEESPVLEIWNLRANKQVAEISLDKKEKIFSLHFLYNNNLLYASSSGEIKIFNANEEKFEGSLYIYNVPMDDLIVDTLVAISPHGNLAAIYFKTYKSNLRATLEYPDMYIFNLKTKSLVKKIKLSQMITSFLFSSDEKELGYVDAKHLFYTLKIFPKILKRLTLSSTLLLWCFEDLIKNKSALTIPEKYPSDYIQLPKKYLEYFFEKNIEMGGAPAAIPYIYPYLEIKKEQEPSFAFVKEKRKEPEEEAEKKSGKKKRPFKKFKIAEYLQYYKQD